MCTYAQGLGGALESVECDATTVDMFACLNVDEVGDKRYLAGEALEDPKHNLDKFDMFALGATLYELARVCTCV